MITEFAYWASRAVEQMKFPPDRETVRQELVNHMEDAREAAMTRGLSEAEATSKVLTAMGDPVETGRLLNQAHKPALGFAWLVSKWLCILLVFLVFWNVLEAEWNWEHLQMDDPCEHLALNSDPVWLDSGLTMEETDYTFLLDHGAWSATPLNAGFITEITLGFQVKGHSPWLLPPGGVWSLYIELPDGQILHRQDQDFFRTWVSLDDSILPFWRLHITARCDSLTYYPWVRFFVPNSDFDLTVYDTGEVTHGT